MDPPRNQVTNARLEKLLNAFELLRILDREMPGQLVSCFLYVASHEHCHKLSLEMDLEFTPASSSRNTDILSLGRAGRESEGLGLIKKEFDPDNLRRQQLVLTPKGRVLAEKMLEILYGESKQPDLETKDP